MLFPSQSLEERCNRILRNMEASLTARDRVGIQDFVLLDAYTSESAFLDNLRKRFHENLIYVSRFPCPSCLVLLWMDTLSLIKHHHPLVDLQPPLILTRHHLQQNVAPGAAETAALVL